MKVLLKNNELCIGCKTCETTCSSLWFKEDNPILSRIKIAEEGNSFNINACNQCGECIDVCPTEAIYRDKNGIVRINENDCVGCLSCVGFCPSQSMFYAPKVNKPFKCIACGACVKTCPTDALSIGEEDTPLEKVFYRENV